MNRNRPSRIARIRLLAAFHGLFAWADANAVEPPVPIHRWSFNGEAGEVLPGSEFSDEIAGSRATVRGVGGRLDDGGLVLPGTSDGNQGEAMISAYLDLPDGIITANESLTVEAWATPLSSRNWQRIFDFGSASTTRGSGAAPGEIVDGPGPPGGFQSRDNIMLTLNIGETLGVQRLESRLEGGGQTSVDLNRIASTVPGVEHQYLLTVEDGVGDHGGVGCRVSWFRDGSWQQSIDLPYRLKAISDVNNWIGRSMWSAFSGSHLSLNELRIYDRAISPDEVAASWSAGPDAVLAAPVAVDDEAVIHAGRKVRMKVLENDRGAPRGSVVEIVTPPSAGIAEVRPEGELLYSHAGGGPDEFSYRVRGPGGYSNPSTVRIKVADQLRIAGPKFNLPGQPPGTAIEVFDAFPGVRFSRALCFASPPGDVRRLFVCEIGGVVKVIPDVAADHPTVSTVIDLRSVIAVPERVPAETITGGANGECGLLGLAFHPDFSANGHFYVAYTVTKAGVEGFSQRLSRFTIPQDQLGLPAPAADPASERILVDQHDLGPNHNGGDLHFGPDGYLYWSVGDQENPHDFRLDSQRIDRNLFSGMLRLDVDKRPGNPEPNDHPSVPKPGGIARYSIPSDNPFIGATSFNGAAVDPARVRTEFYAVGLRSPWRFSFDPLSGELWLGDVGQARYEELNVIVRGGNYGWVHREGAHDINVANPGWPVKPEPFEAIDPLFEYVHNGMPGDFRFKGNAIIGGVFYHGGKVPALNGSYVFGDQTSGHIWSLRRDGGEVKVERIAGQPYLSNFGIDPSNGDVLVSDYYGGRIMRLAVATDDERFPATLAETGLFADLADLSPAPGLLPYEANLAFWSDHAVKRRWFALQDDDSAMSGSLDGPWAFPAGQVWVKHFDLETGRGNPSTLTRIETRVLVRNEEGAYGVSYRWNDEGDQAFLAADEGEDVQVAVETDGVPGYQSWRIPGRSECLSCHTPAAGHALSFNTRQLHREGDIHGFRGDQIELLEHAGYLTDAPGPADRLPRHFQPDDESVSLEARARSYLDVNCGYCHRPGGSGPGWDGRSHLGLDRTGMVRGPVSGALQAGDRLVVPGDPAHSVILSRISLANGYARMPPIGSHELDSQGIALLTEWIRSELPLHESYEAWSRRYFAAGDPAAARESDPDGDGMDNHEEFLRGDSPLSGESTWRVAFSGAGGAAGIGFPRRAFRKYRIETSRDLGAWERWDHPRNVDGYDTIDRWEEIPIDMQEGPHRFFRVGIEDP